MSEQRVTVELTREVAQELYDHGSGGTAPHDARVALRVGLRSALDSGVGEQRPISETGEMPDWLEEAIGLLRSNEEHDENCGIPHPADPDQTTARCTCGLNSQVQRAEDLLGEKFDALLAEVEKQVNIAFKAVGKRDAAHNRARDLEAEREARLSLEEVRERLLSDEAIDVALDKALALGGVSVHRFSIKDGIEAALDAAFSEDSEAPEQAEGGGDRG